MKVLIAQDFYQLRGSLASVSSGCLLFGPDPCLAAVGSAKRSGSDRRGEMEAMGRLARVEYKAKYTAERNYEMLMEIYGRAASRKR